MNKPPKVEEVTQCRDLRPEWQILIPAVVLIIMVSIPALLFPEKTQGILTGIYQSITAAIGSAYLWFTLFLVVLCIFFSFSRYGDIKLGRADDKPEYSLTSWVAMIFCSGVAGASMFWAIVEPQWNLLIPPQNAAPMSMEAYEWSLAYLLLHWGPNAWCSYFICALPIAYIFHIRNKPSLRLSTSVEILIGKQKDGILGRLLDIFFIMGMLFCTTCTMVLSLPTVEAALASIFGIQPSFTVEIVVLAVCAGVAATSVYLGLKKGIQNLSRANIVIAMVLIGYAFLMGPSAKLFDIFTNATGKMLGNYMNMSLWTDPFTPGTFPQDWTIFYALFWAGYGPFMGLFIARISRGRTIREVIGWGMFGTILGGYLIHGVFGSYTLYLQSSGTLDVISILQSQGGPASMMAVLDSLPFGKIVMLAYIAFSVIFLATSIDSSCYVIASTVTRRMSHDDDPHRVHRVIWAVAQALLALGALSMGGLEIAKIFGNFAGVFMILPITLLVVSWFMILKHDGARMLAYHVPKKPLPPRDDIAEECPPPREFFS